ncbi:MAG: hypothetical protein Q7J55_04200 [bacterium]|nr:hypothetical protein [bacterium]
MQDIPRKQDIPKNVPIRPGEKVIWFSPGMYDIGTIAPLWRMGHLYLTNERLFFERQGRIQFAALLADIVDVELVMRKWILQHIRQLRIRYRTGKRLAYVAVGSPVGWEKIIKDRIILSLMEKSLRPEGLRARANIKNQNDKQ